MSPFGRRRAPPDGRLPGARRLTGRRPIIIEQDRIAPASLSAGLGRRLGPKARFLGAALLIGVVITAACSISSAAAARRRAVPDRNNLARLAMPQPLSPALRRMPWRQSAGQPGWQGDYPAGDRPATLNGTGWPGNAPTTTFSTLSNMAANYLPRPIIATACRPMSVQADGDIWAILAYGKALGRRHQAAPTRPAAGLIWERRRRTPKTPV